MYIGCKCTFGNLKCDEKCTYFNLKFSIKYDARNQSKSIRKQNMERIKSLLQLRSAKDICLLSDKVTLIQRCYILTGWSANNTSLIMKSSKYKNGQGCRLGRFSVDFRPKSVVLEYTVIKAPFSRPQNWYCTTWIAYKNKAFVSAKLFMLCILATTVLMPLSQR